MMTKVDIERGFGGRQAIMPFSARLSAATQPFLDISVEPTEHAAIPATERSSKGQTGSIDRQRPFNSGLAQDFLDLFARH
jgi:hypothetical protein